MDGVTEVRNEIRLKPLFSSNYELKRIIRDDLLLRDADVRVVTIEGARALIGAVETEAE